MKKLVFLFAVFCTLFFIVSPAFALKIAPLSTKKLVERSNLIVMGKVISVQDKTNEKGQKEGIMHIRVKLGSMIKGEISIKEFTLMLDYGSSRKSFDPKLKLGDLCVFFLHSITEGRGKLAHWGSIAKIQDDYLYTP